MLSDAIYEAMESLGRTGTISQVTDWISTHYPEYGDSDIGTAMADLTVDGNQSSQYAQEKKVLQRIDRGTYSLV